MIDNLTYEIIQGLPTGTILKLKKNKYKSDCKENQLCMVLRDIKHQRSYGNIVSGEVWKPLHNVKLEDVKGIYQPTSNMYYLNKEETSGITTVGTETLWEFKEKTKRELKLEKLHKQAQDIADQIAELD